MWVFTKQSFLSVVEYDPSKDKEPKSIFKKYAHRKGTHVLVRARVKADLEALRPWCHKMKIDTDEHADYMFRVVIPRKTFAKFMADQVEMIDYDSHFKEVVRANATQSTERYSAMMSVWSAMNRLQPYKKWSYGSGGYYGGGHSAPVGGTKSGSPLSGVGPKAHDDSEWDSEWVGWTGTSKPVAKQLQVYDIDLEALKARLQTTAPKLIEDDYVNRLTDEAYEVWAEAEMAQQDKVSRPLTLQEVEDLIDKINDDHLATAAEEAEADKKAGTH